MAGAQLSDLVNRTPPALQWRWTIQFSSNVAGLFKASPSSHNIIASSPITATAGILSQLGGAFGLGGAVTGLLIPAGQILQSAFTPSKQGVTDLALYAETVRAPMLYVDSRQVFYQGRYRNFPKDGNIDQLDIMFYEDENYAVSTFLQDWRSLILDSDGNYGYPSQYYATVVMNLINLQGEAKAQLAYTGVWPTRSPELSFESEGSNRQQVSCAFAVNKGAVNGNLTDTNGSISFQTTQAGINAAVLQILNQ